MNIPKILTPKAMTAYIGADDTVRQGLEVMRHHGYTAIPVLGEHGEYIGCITEGDFLWHILATGTTSLNSTSRSTDRHYTRQFDRIRPLRGPGSRDPGIFR